jgi:hypothetical protein
VTEVEAVRKTKNKVGKNYARNEIEEGMTDTRNTEIEKDNKSHRERKAERKGKTKEEVGKNVRRNEPEEGKINKRNRENGKESKSDRERKAQTKKHLCHKPARQLFGYSSHKMKLPSLLNVLRTR